MLQSLQPFKISKSYRSQVQLPSPSPTAPDLQLLPAWSIASFRALRCSLEGDHCPPSSLVACSLAQSWLLPLASRRFLIYSNSSKSTSINRPRPCLNPLSPCNPSSSLLIPLTFARRPASSSKSSASTQLSAPSPRRATQRPGCRSAPCRAPRLPCSRGNSHRWPMASSASGPEGQKPQVS